MIRPLSLSEAAALYDGPVKPKRKAEYGFQKTVVLPFLTPRLEQLARLMVEGRPGKEIAAEMGITVGSLKEARNRLYRRIGVSNMAGFFAWWYTVYLPREVASLLDSRKSEGVQ